MPGNSSKKPAKHATRATTSAPAAGTAGATDPPSGEPEVAGGNETFATPQAQGIGRQQAGVTDGKVDQSEEDSKTELELYRGLVQQLEARLQGLEDRLGQDAQSDNESVGKASSGAPPAASDQGRRLTQAEARDLNAFCTRPGCFEPVWCSPQGELFDFCSRTCGKATGPKKLARSVAAGSTAEDPLCPDEDDADALSELGLPDRRASAYFPKYVIVDPATNNVQWTNQTVQRHVEAKPPLQRQYALDVLVLYELLAEANAMAVQAGAPITRRDLDPIFQVVTQARECLGAMVDAYAVFKTTNADDILTARRAFDEGAEDVSVFTTERARKVMQKRYDEDAEAAAKKITSPAKSKSSKSDDSKSSGQTRRGTRGGTRTSRAASNDDKDNNNNKEPKRRGGSKGPSKGGGGSKEAGAAAE